MAKKVTPADTPRWKSHPWKTRHPAFKSNPEKTARLGRYAGEASAQRARDRRLAEGE